MNSEESVDRQGIFHDLRSHLVSVSYTASAKDIDAKSLAWAWSSISLLYYAQHPCVHDVCLVGQGMVMGTSSQFNLRVGWEGLIMISPNIPLLVHDEVLVKDG